MKKFKEKNNKKNPQHMRYKKMNPCRKALTKYKKSKR
jgi:hypothetical protein